MIFKNREDALEQRASWKKENLKVGFTSGVFDILHAGHVDYLEKAKSHCDRLVVGVNTDASVKKNKGPARPIQNESHRLRLVSALKCVDGAYLFSELNNHENIGLLKPDVYIKAGDYDKSKLTSAPMVEAYGGHVEIIPVHHEISTTSIVEEVISKNCSYARVPGQAVRPVVFLDRDGVINEEIEYLHLPEQFKLTENCLEGLEMLSAAGYALVLVTNQAGIGLGYFSHEDFYKVNRELFRHLQGTNIMIDKIYYCPHAFSESCSCRKPGTGMLERAFDELNLTKDGSYIIGDRESDVEAGINFGVKSILMAGGKQKTQAGHQVKDLSEAAKIIVGS